MSFRNVFPVTLWLWRRLSSRWACRIYVFGLAIIVIPAVALRIQSVLFERRALKIMADLSSLRIGVTSKTDALSRIPGLDAVNCTDGDRRCSGEEQFSIAVPNSRISDWLLLPTGRAGHETLFSILSWWGVRFWNLDAYVYFTSGRVSALGYRLVLSIPNSRYPGGLSVAASSREQPVRAPLAWDVDQSPNYVVTHYFKWPDLDMHVDFTRNAAPELVRHAFNLQLHCLWFLAGCRTANQLLPEAEQDRQEIRRAAIDRMRGPDQCPTWLLPRRARDVQDILLVEVKHASPTLVESGGVVYRFASFRLLRVLKGKPGRPLDNIGVASDLSLGELQIHNSAIDLLNPGQRLLLFSGASLYIDEPCEAMDATQKAVQTMDRELSKASP
jgi:hypothetical protein